jgi:hypothetical protein
MKRTLWIIGILLGLGAIAAIVCKKMCGECHCHADGEEEKAEGNGEVQQIEEEQEDVAEEAPEEEEVS